MHSFSQNNLHQSASPYLRQHAQNPVWWQEFTSEVLQHARMTGKPIFISSGYSTCHWCHVMAADAFSDHGVADFLAQHFISIKLDREMHPDIDSFLMAFIQQQTGQGGWPLNVFLTPNLKPFFAMTYAGTEPRHGMPPFVDILLRVNEWFAQHGDEVLSFNPNQPDAKQLNQNKSLPEQIEPYLDFHHGGTSGAPKFPPHSLLFYLLHQKHLPPRITRWTETTIDTMLLSGLHDHLQGGFYRYCVDQNWKIPHFEKMLYDQAMMLINFSLAFRVFGHQRYQAAARKIIECLHQTFATGQGYASAWDADTHHHEGLTYLWTASELGQLLTEDELKQWMTDYDLEPFEGANHLIRRHAGETGMAEQKLLKARRLRPQPFRDEKIITSWNAWIGSALVFAHRYAGLDTLDEASQHFNHLLKHHVHHRRVIHSVAGGEPQKEGYLEDAAAMFYLATLLYEERLTDEATVDQLREATLQFRQHAVWYESLESPLGSLPAAQHDHPLPASSSAADAALTRWDLLNGGSPKPLPLNRPLVTDFYNWHAEMAHQGGIILKGPEKIGWEQLPLGALQGRNHEFILCESNTCRKYEPVSPAK